MKQILLVILCFITTQVAFAATDEFTIQSLVGGDIVPPTTPLNVLATPVTSAQIDVSWDASSDNFALGGYQVFRDTIQIATTSLVNFSDTGLTASTSYDYTIRAFDTSFNFSTTSATATAVTLPVVVATTTPTTTPEISFGGRIVNQAAVRIDTINIDTQIDSATVSFSTNRLTQAEIAWGRTVDFELGFSTGAAFKKDHQVLINGLAPDSVYELQIQVRDSSGKIAIETVSFRTLSRPDVQAPANPMNFSAIGTETGVQLSWTNPNEDDFQKVRVLSSDQFYPTDLQGGYLVYEGDAAETFDGRTADSARRFYTIFAYDEAGNSSSGAVTEIYFSRSTGEIDEAQSNAALDDTVDISLPMGENTTVVSIADISFSDRRGNVAVFVDERVVITNNQTTLISVPYERLPEHLKTVIVRLVHPQNGKVFAFLLRVNADKTAYEAEIGALLVPGEYDFSFEVFDFKTKGIKKLTGVIEVRQITVFKDTEAVFASVWFIWLLPLFVLLGIMARRLFQQREDMSV